MAGAQQPRRRREWRPSSHERPTAVPASDSRCAWQYSYRLCPAAQHLTEACFQAHQLSFVREEHSLVDRNNSVHPVNGTFVTEGTFPHGSEWARIPIPSVALGACCIAGPNDTATCDSTDPHRLRPTFFPPFSIAFLSSVFDRIGRCLLIRSALGLVVAAANAQLQDAEPLLARGGNLLRGQRTVQAMPHDARERLFALRQQQARAMRWRARVAPLWQARVSTAASWRTGLRSLPRNSRRPQGAGRATTRCIRTRLAVRLRGNGTSLEQLRGEAAVWTRHSLFAVDVGTALLTDTCVVACVRTLRSYHPRRRHQRPRPLAVHSSVA